MAASRAVRRATFESTSKIASEFGEAAIQVLQRVTDFGGDHGKLVKGPRSGKIRSYAAQRQ
jgi:hypothetical protein